MIERGVLRIRLLIYRIGPLRGAIYTIAVLAVVAALFVPLARKHVLHDLRVESTRITTKVSQAPSTALVAVSDRVDAFRRALGSVTSINEYVQVLLDIADEHRLIIRKAEYRRNASKAGGYYMYEVMLPLQSDYDSVRAFCDDTLRALPFTSVDSISFTRKAADVTQLEAKLVMTMFLTDTPVRSDVAARSKRAASTPIATEIIIH